MSLKRIALTVLFITSLIVAIITTWIYSQLDGSLPLLEGKTNVYGLKADVNIARDAQGIATITANNREDLATATGFIHAQERFFQMDLLRKNSAGELSSLFGDMTLAYDKSNRLHNFRKRAIDIINHLPNEQLSLLKAYAKGVNSGLDALKSPPFEYLLLQQTPAQWREEDSVLVIMSMYLDLQEAKGKREQSLATLYQSLGSEVFSFLTPKGSQWDATIDNTDNSNDFSPNKLPKSPWPNVTSTSNNANSTYNSTTLADYQTEQMPGSNNWAVAGNISQTGSAIVANDMHLGLSVPNTWFRASFSYPYKDKQINITGLTLPGTPLMVTGSNGHIAWGFTNSYGDWSDVIALETNADKSKYLTPEGYKAFTYQRHMIAVKGKEPTKFISKETIWGPVISAKDADNLLAYRWVAHDRQAVNFYAQALEYTHTAEHALEVAAKSGIPQQNFVVGDSAGNIGWTIMGAIPKKSTDFGDLPHSWANGDYSWQGYLLPQAYPKVLNPSTDRLWTANSRVVGGKMYEVIGNGGYALGARSHQIKQRLFEKQRFNEEDLLAIALDDDALFLKRWRNFILATVLTDETLEKFPNLTLAKNIIESESTLKASVDSVAYRIVRNFRITLRNKLFSELNDTLSSTTESFDFSVLAHQIETPLWQLITQKPTNYTALPASNWQQLFVDSFKEVINKMTENQSLDEATWGQQNVSNITHPLSNGVPLIGYWLDMPEVALPGDSYMPRVQGRAFGASQRMVVSPGHESSGIMQMPTSQSSHPWSPFYKKGHSDWQKGTASPFLPGKTQYNLTLVSY
ncbi:penicillin acylase family protein [Thalassotalea piscium]